MLNPMLRSPSPPMELEERVGERWCLVFQKRHSNYLPRFDVLHHAKLSAMAGPRRSLAAQFPASALNNASISSSACAGFANVWPISSRNNSR